MVHIDPKKPPSIIAEAAWRLEARLGHVALSARHHQLPRRIEDDYSLSSEVLGTGINGSVISAKRRGCHSGQTYAVKSFALSRVDAKKRENFAAEAEVFLCMDHPNVVRLYDVYETNEFLHFVMERLPGGELFDRVKQQRSFAEPQASDVSWQLLLALNYIHSHGIVHGDVKLENVLYNAPGSSHVKLIDFGFSKRWDPSSQLGVVGRVCGTRSYIAPEVLLERPCTSKCDLWSLGVVVFVLLFGYMPFRKAEDIVAGNYHVIPEKWKRVSEEGIDFVRSLLTVDPAERLSAQEALNHPWIAQRHAMSTHRADPATVQALRNFSNCPLLRRCCMQVAAWSLSEKECALVEDIFLKMDVKHEGRITFGELRKELPAQMDDAEVRQIFQALVSDHDQEIHYSDFLAAMLDSRIKITDELLRGAFERLDLEHSGHVTVSNLFEVLGEHHDKQQVISVMKEAGITSRGSFGYKEFEVYMRGGELRCAAPRHMQQACCSVQ
jgi:calcium-dependent protein kinase